jgi:UDP-2,3-diacylglucosamine hydrolase
MDRLQAPEHWQAVDLISDLHLQAGEPQTFDAWRQFMAGTRADAVLILGDLFEVWIGDDAAASDPFLQDCAQVLRSAANRLTVGFMAGNRDFLLGPAFAQACGMRPLQDPTLLCLGQMRTVLSHGDALCLDDVDYQRFRRQVRSPQWQQAFLAQSLAERQAVARALRTQSEAHKRLQMHAADADATMSRQWLQEADSLHLVHGHTHRPADHLMDPALGLSRQVLSDWSLDHAPRRAEVLRLHRDGRCERLSPQQACEA